MPASTQHRSSGVRNVLLRGFLVLCMGCGLWGVTGAPAAQNTAVSPAQASASLSAAPVGAAGQSGHVPQTLPPGFVIVQTSYLEQLATSSKASIDAVSLTAQTAINASKDKEAWLVSIIQIVGLVLAALAGCAVYFGFEKYKEVSAQLSEIKKASENAKQSTETLNQNIQKANRSAATIVSKQQELDTKIANTNKLAEEFEEKLDEIEAFLIGIHSQNLVMNALRVSQQKIVDAHAELDGAIKLYDIAKKHENKRIQSFMAANLSLIYMYAERWSEAYDFGKEAMECNPKGWSDRLYNMACICARKFDAGQEESDREEAKAFIIQYFERSGKGRIALEELDEAIADDDLMALRDELKAMKTSYASLAAQTMGMSGNAPPTGDAVRSEN